MASLESEILSLRPTRRRKQCYRNILIQCCSQCCRGEEQTGRKQNIFCFRYATSTSSKYVAWVRKRGNNRETFKASVSSVFSKCFLVCALTQHMLKAQNLRLERKKMFSSFSRNMFCVLDAILLPLKCFLVCAGL